MNNIAYEMTSRPTTTTFIAPARSNYGFEDDIGVEVLMTVKMLKKYRNDANGKRALEMRKYLYTISWERNKIE